MKYYIFIYRSLTFAQKGVRILNRAGVPSSIVRPPTESSKEGCAYGVKIRAEKYNAALSALVKEGWTSSKIIQVD